MFTVCAWAWGSKYAAHYEDRLAAGVARNLKQEHRFMIFRPEPEDMHLTEIPGCFARLRTFDPAWQARNGIAEGDRILCLDLDLIVTGSLDAIVDRTEPFVILQGANAKNTCRYNGSAWLLRAGYRPDVWDTFSVAAASKVKFWAFPEDQSWFEHMMPDAGAYAAKDGVYAFKKTFWPNGDGLPAGARIVAFPGSRDQSQFCHLPWVRDHWR